MAAHYSVGILPARPKRPRDKAAVEAGVRFAQSYILGRLRNVTFFSLAECNAAIAVAVERMNGREMRRLGVSRRQLFETVERPLMQALPQDDYEYAEWHLARVGIDYHVEVQGFSYSVPHSLLREQVNTRATPRRSRYSIAASALPPMCGATADSAMALCLSTCRARTGATPGPRRQELSGYDRHGRSMGNTALR
jgi:hypothetical protein